MEIIPESEGAVTFRTHVVSSQSRDALALLDVMTVRSESLVKICGWCTRVQANDSWVEIEDAISVLQLFEAPRLPTLSHGMCPSCYDVMIASLDAPADPIPLA